MVGGAVSGHSSLLEERKDEEFSGFLNEEMFWA